jgi:hypothetical protein
MARRLHSRWLMKEAEPAPSVAQVLEKTIRDALQLVSAEIAVARADATEQVRSAARSAVLLAVGVMFLQAAVTLLGVAVLLVVRDTALGFAVVGALVAIALVLGILAIRGMKRHEMRGAERLKLDARAIAEAVK